MHPGTYEISLATDTSLSSNLVLGQLAPLADAPDAWQLTSLSFSAPAGAGTHPLLVFIPLGSASGGAYPGVNSLSLVGAVASGVPKPAPRLLIVARLAGLLGWRQRKRVA